MNKVKSKCGFTTKVDTVKVVVPFYTKEIKGNDSTKVSFDSVDFKNKIEELINNNFKLMDSISKMKLVNGFKTIYKEKKCLKDTFTILPKKKGSYIKIWQTNDKFMCDYYFPKDTFYKAVSVPVSTTNYNTNFWESNKWFFLILFIGILAVYVLKR